ncbi:MAG TPA: triose-phosphate isomerase [Armatimonadota bacterium]|nr:triose-phosphate isomerase [Armatimonadota bacterium]
MSNRIPIIAGNWKMNKTASEAEALVREIAPAAADTRAETVVCPPFLCIPAAVAAARGTQIKVGAQDLFWKESGAYTGQIAPGMLADAGVTHVIIGHSERRGRFGVAEEGFTPEVLALFGESDRTVNLKVHAALKHGLVPIVCCGETLDERRAGRTDEVVAGQIERGLAGLSAEQAGGLVVAYEPVWAIGTGETCAAEEADRVCGVVRATVGRLYGAAAAEAVRVQYGGSVKPDNAEDLLSRPNIDGALVGGASLKASDFNAILRAAS